MTRGLRIGTAGWSIPAPWREAFPGPGSLLERYARRLTCVEINSSFYRPHRRETYERWARSTPAGFRFAVKAPRQLIQIQRLRDPEAGLDRFAGEVSGLGRKLGVLLMQSPPSLALEPEIAKSFFLALRERIAAPIACEPRHASWFTPEAERLLKRLRIARVAADPPPVAEGRLPGGWRGLTYLRLHGSPRIYWSGYSAERLAETAADLAQAGPKTWCIFDNTAAGCALGDAMTVIGALGAPQPDIRRLAPPAAKTRP